MRSTFPEFLYQQLFKHEGGYVDHPRDPGGATNFGITFKTLGTWRRAPVTKADVRALRKDEAAQIYKALYWDKIGADLLPAGVDAALFDVAVNSGTGRAMQWKPLGLGKSPVEGVKAVCARRRAFFRSLSTFDVFGKGWMRRVNEVEAWCIAWAAKVAGGDVKEILRKEQAAADTKVKQNSAGAGTVGAGGAGVSTQVDWTLVAIIGIPVALALGYLIYNAVAEAGRAKALKEAANNV